MGRWLKKVDHALETAVTKPTEPNFVSFVTADSTHIQQKKQNLIQFVTHCCNDLKVEPLRIIAQLLSDEDKQDIESGNIVPDILRLHIELWLANKMLQ